MYRRLNFLATIPVHSDDGSPEDWEFMTLLSWVSDGGDNNGPSPDTSMITDDFKQRAEVFGEPFRTIVRSIPADTPSWHNRLSFWPTQSWDGRNGTVALAGDAAHPMTFRKLK